LSPRFISRSLLLHLAQAVPVVIHDLSGRNFVVFEHFGGDALAGDDDLRFFIEILPADDDLKVVLICPPAGYTKPMRGAGCARLETATARPRMQA
jgi:hypothetical protein